MIILAAGVVVATRPISVLGADCGSVIRPAAGITPMECDGRLDDRGTLALAIGLGGSATVVTSIGLALRSTRRTSP